MTQFTKEQLEECKKLQDAILDLCKDKTEVVSINAIMSALINESHRFDIPPINIVTGTIIGFGLAIDVYSAIDEIVGKKETKH